MASLASSIIVQTASRASRRRVPIFLTAFSQAFVFRQPGELLLGTMLAYYFRLLERQMGTGKYAAYVLAASGISFTLQAVVSSLWHRPSASGLYPILFSNLVAFFLEVPPLQKFSFLGINMSDKAFIYLVALQLLFAGSQRSVVAALSGLLAGLVYHTNCFGMRRLRVINRSCFVLMQLPMEISLLIYNPCGIYILSRTFPVCPSVRVLLRPHLSCLITIYYGSKHVLSLRVCAAAPCDRRGNWSDFWPSY